MKQFNRLNNLAGLGVFLITLIVYTLTLEPTVSFWDCGEFISAAVNQEVVHPPGAPLFLLLGRIFSLFAADIAHKAVMINFLSGLTSALSMLFLYWSITMLGLKLYEKRQIELNQGNIIALLGAGIVGALSGAFLDSFWFSAVEGEVYATSSFFTILIFWCMLKWDRRADDLHSDRWIVLIALLVGLGTGVHLLHLLALPAMAYIYYFRKWEKVTWKGMIVTFFVGFGLTAFVLFGVLDYLIRIAAWFDLQFVNGMGLPFWSGVIFFGILLSGLLVLAWLYAGNTRKWWIRTAVLSFVMIVIGISSFVTVIIRANANPPINMNDPSDIYTLHSYLKRDQYGHRPLLYGPYFTAQPIDTKVIRTRYMKGTDDKGNPKYIEAGKQTEYVFTFSRKLEDMYRQQGYPEAQIQQIKAEIARTNKMTLFPRMGSIGNPEHADAYRAWLNMSQNAVPDFGDNLRYFFKYQIGYMYWRYFFWNFSGRQDDMQGHIQRGRNNGNWLTGIPAIDEARIGPEYNRSESRYNKARNQMYMIPFLLGLIGLFYHYKEDKKGAWIIFMLFFWTGIMNIVNANEPPFEPRERDYALAISFYSYAMWIGFAVLAIYQWLSRKMQKRLALSLALVAGLVSPVLLISQEWDDHDRSGSYMALDSARDYLESCAPNAILFTQGDNDTYPLWYAQEVEGIRNDVRVINLSLLAVDWYINQLTYKINNSDPVKLRFKLKDYLGDKRQVIDIKEDKKFVARYGNDINTVLDFIKSDNPNTKLNIRGYATDYLPTRTITIPVDTAKVIANGTVDPRFAKMIKPRITMKLGKGKRSLIRDELIIMDIIASNNWERPIYFAITVPENKHLGLHKYLQREGLAYRLVPVELPTNEWTNTDIMYDNIMNKWHWGGADTNHIYLNETGMRTAQMLRSNLLFLAQTLANNGEFDKAVAVLEKCFEAFKQENVPFYDPQQLYPVVGTYYRCKAPDKAAPIVMQLIDLIEEDMEFWLASERVDRMRKASGNRPDFLREYLSKNPEQVPYAIRNLFQDFSMYGSLVSLAGQGGDTAMASDIQQRLELFQQQNNVTDPMSFFGN